MQALELLKITLKNVEKTTKTTLKADYTLLLTTQIGVLHDYISTYQGNYRFCKILKNK